MLRAAIGNNASSYLEAKVWRPFMEHPATWNITENVELGGCCIHATLRDYARIGIFGQLIWVHPKDQVVIVTHSAWPAATGSEFSAHRWALVEALHAHVAEVD